MSIISTTPMVVPRSLSDGRVSQIRVIRSEWTKFRSLRSTRYALLATVVLTVGLALVAALVAVSQWSTMNATDKATFAPLGISVLGANLAVLVIGVLGVLMTTSEFSTGLVSSTLAAVPKRLPVLWGKSAVYSAVALTVTVPAMLVAFFASQAILSSNGLQIDFGHSGVARSVLGSALFLTITGLLGLGLGGIFRSTAATVSTLLGILFVLPALVTILPASLANSISPYLPGNAGRAITTLAPPPHMLGPWVGLGVFAAYALAAIAAAAFLLVRRDA